MKGIAVHILVFNILTAYSIVTGFADYDGWINVGLHHSLDGSNPENFLYRGNVTVSNINSGSFNVAQSVLSPSNYEHLKVINVTPYCGSQLDSFELARQKGFYHIRAEVMYGNGFKHTFLSSSNACSLLMSQLNDMLRISVDSFGFVTAVTHAVALPSLSTDNCSDVPYSGESFNTDVFIKYAEQAPVPDTTSFIQKIEHEREARERGETKDNRGFLAKYWMYIIPVVILVFISGATNQEAAK